MHFWSLSGDQGVEERWSPLWVTGRVLCSLKVPGSLQGIQMALGVQTGAVAAMPGLLPRIGTHTVPP